MLGLGRQEEQAFEAFLKFSFRCNTRSEDLVFPTVFSFQVITDVH